MQISQEELYDIENALYDLGAGDFTIRTDYSGRGMYGKECIGFEFDSQRGEMLISLAFAEVFDVSTAVKMVSNANSDSMGLGTIVYFPNLQLSEEES